MLLTGPRQVGKSTMLRHLMEGTARAEVSLDDLEERRLAKTDPAMFLKLHPAPVLIDEVQYAPELFSYIKIAVDNGAAPGSYWLTGSQAYRLMELAQESLAGRTAILHMSALSQSELCGAMEVSPFSLELDELQKRKAVLSPATPKEICLISTAISASRRSTPFNAPAACSLAAFTSAIFAESSA